jgi:hypothetical protein
MLATAPFVFLRLSHYTRVPPYASPRKMLFT